MRVRRLVGRFLSAGYRRSHGSARRSESNSCVSRKKSSLEDKVYEQVTAECLLQAGDRVLLQVSGGCDSMAMLHVFAALRSKWQPPLEIEVIHFNHFARSESVEEEQFVSTIAQSYGMPLHIRHLDKTILQQSNFQANARTWRRNESLQVLNRPVLNLEEKRGEHEKKSEEMYCRGRAVVATGHHLDDQVETSLLKLVRGTHLSHLHPMLPINDQFIRPMLTVTKQEILNYMQKEGFEWREDASNLTDAYKRNVIRHDLVPVMSGLAGSQAALYKRIEEIGAQSIQLKTWMRKEVEEYKAMHPQSVRCVARAWCDIPIEAAFQSLPHMVQSEYLRSLIDTFTNEVSGDAIALTFEILESVLRMAKVAEVRGTASNGKNASLSLSKYWLVSRVGAVLRIQHTSFTRNDSNMCNYKYMTRELINAKDGSVLTVAYPVELVDLNISMVSDTDVTVTPESAKGWGVHADSGPASLLSEESIVILHSVPSNASLSIRTRMDGDVFSPGNYHKQGPMKLSSFFQDKKVPLHARDHLPLITCVGQIIAVPPYLDRRFMVREDASPHANMCCEQFGQKKTDTEKVGDRKVEVDVPMSLVTISLKISPATRYLY